MNGARRVTANTCDEAIISSKAYTNRMHFIIHIHSISNTHIQKFICENILFFLKMYTKTHQCHVQNALCLAAFHLRHQKTLQNVPTYFPTLLWKIPEKKFFFVQFKHFSIAFHSTCFFDAR